MTESKSKTPAPKSSPTEPAPLAADAAGAPDGRRANETPNPSPTDLDTRERKAQRADGLPVEIPVEDGVIVATQGDPRTEPVATAHQSHVPGRVGPRTFAEDPTSPLVVDELDEVEPGTIRPDTPEGVGPVPIADLADSDPQGEYLARLSDELERRAEPKRQGPVQLDPDLARLQARRDAERLTDGKPTTRP